MYRLLSVALLITMAVAGGPVHRQSCQLHKYCAVMCRHRPLEWVSAYYWTMTPNEGGRTKHVHVKHSTGTVENKIDSNFKNRGIHMLAAHNGGFLIIPEVQQSDEGFYECLVIGSQESVFTELVILPGNVSIINIALFDVLKIDLLILSLCMQMNNVK